jgi:hypothetical protein
MRNEPAYSESSRVHAAPARTRRQRAAGIAPMLLAIVACAAVAEPVAYVDSAFPEATPVTWSRDGDNLLTVRPLPDPERESRNLAVNHWFFAIDGTPGHTFSLRIEGLENIYKGRPGIPFLPRFQAWRSEDRVHWEPLPFELRPNRGTAQAELSLRATRTWIARLPPYGLAELAALLRTVRESGRATVTEIGRSVHGRPLELVSLGRADARHRVLIRARAHAWEAGGSWVADALVRAALARPLPDGLALDVLPMANPDSVASGRSRFNARGVDLNRSYQPADPQLAPENAALEAWMERQLAAGRRPAFFVELHNDHVGKIHFGRAPESLGRSGYQAMVERYATLLTRMTWFSEGTLDLSQQPILTLPDAFASRFGAPGVVHELHADWIAARKQAVDLAAWREFGAALPQVLAELLAER